MGSVGPATSASRNAGWGSANGCAAPGHPTDQLQAGAQEQLERLQIGEGPAEEEGGVHRIGGGRERQEGHHPLRAGRHQAQPGRRDHAERALAAAEQPRQVVAGVVLEQPAQVRHDRPRPEHGLDPGQLGPGGAVPEHLEPAGIGGDGAADRGAVPAPQVDPVGPPRRHRGRLHVGHRRPGAGGQLPGTGSRRR